MKAVYKSFDNHWPKKKNKQIVFCNFSSENSVKRIFFTFFTFFFYFLKNVLNKALKCCIKSASGVISYYDYLVDDRNFTLEQAQV